MHWRQTRNQRGCRLQLPHGFHEYVLRRATSLDHMPLDIILLIAGLLPAYSQVLLSLTCRSLHFVVGDWICRRGMVLEWSEYMQYLSCVSRDLLDRWVCDECTGLHYTHEGDTPSKPQSAPCPSGWDLLARTGFELGSFRLGHRHVQQSLKFARVMPSLTRAQILYFCKLMRQHHDEDPATFRSHDRGITLSHAVYPKIIHKRYLALSVWIFTAKKVQIEPMTLGFLKICRHQRFGPLLWEALQQWTEDAFQEREMPPATTVCFMNMCAFCSVDVEVCVSSEYAEVKAWYDFGGEISTEDPKWREMVYDPRRDGMATAHEVRIRRLGAIRRLYGTQI